MNRAFEEQFGLTGAFDGIEMAGRTDKWIFEDAASRAAVGLSGDTFHRFRDRYCARLLEALSEPTHLKGVLPGVQNLLEAISARNDVFPALLTGNCEGGARIKLQHFDLWRFFRCGAFGDDVTDRNHLFDVAMQRAEACGVPRVTRGDVFVVGDTVLDVACAQAAGARSVGVATGTVDVDTLRNSGADVALKDLSDTEAFLRMLGVQI